ncbi:MAG TPA: tubulin-like doman-containing protein, partial [Gemmataceae bacterium]|nr:tubulin-like doman-containing protein [Gemmataceae bacterium]
MAIRIAPGAEPIPGYRLLERLGGGGYGEVWKAEAPGGLLKAIKIVHGDLRAVDPASSQFAFQELSALKRVQAIRHPYLLSIDRYDLIGGKLYVVTELADGSLWDRFRARKKEGETGIDRDLLLQYMQEAAEVLDLMHTQHNLQHLDIKPQNLFLVHDHVKVADFGLVSDLQGINAITTGGLTPIYAAPETFDGILTRHCDQYSLAVVYQELLTGTRPFPGGSVQEIILQHLQTDPDVSALPPSDRTAVARALAKRPEDRFPSCKSFVKALRGGSPADSSVVVPTASAASPPPTQPARDGVLVPAVVIGIGQAGLAVLRRLRQIMTERFGPPDSLPHLRLFAVDTDAGAAQAALNGPGALTAAEVLTARLNRAAHYLKPRPDGRSVTDTWLPSGLLNRIPRVPAAQGIRALGRLAFADHSRAIAAKIETDLLAVTRPEALARAAGQTGLGVRSERPRVVIVAGLGGGTGGGMFLDLAYLVRQKLRRNGHPPDVSGVLILPRPARDSTTASQATANACAGLTELHHFSLPDTSYQSHLDGPETAVTSPEAPFDRTIVLPQTADAADLTGELLTRELLTRFGRDLDAHRAAESGAAGHGPAVYVHTFGQVRFAAPRRPLLERAARRLALRLLDRWGSAEAKRQQPAVLQWVTDQWKVQELGPEPLIARFNKVCQETLGQPADTAFAAAFKSTSPRSTVMTRLEEVVGRADGRGAPGKLADVVRQAAAPLADEWGQRMTQLAVCLIEQPAFRLAGAEMAMAMLRDATERALAHTGPLSENLLRKAAAAADRVHGLLTVPHTRPTAPAELSTALEAFPKLRLQGLILRQVAAVYAALRVQLTHALDEIGLCRQHLLSRARALRTEDEHDRVTGAVSGYLLPPGCTSIDEAADQLVASVTVDERRELDHRIQEHLESEFGGLATACLTPDGPVKLTARVREAAAAVLAPRAGEADTAAAFLAHFAGEEPAMRALADAHTAAVPPFAAAGLPELSAIALPPGSSAATLRDLA